MFEGRRNLRAARKDFERIVLPNFMISKDKAIKVQVATLTALFIQTFRHHFKKTESELWLFHSGKRREYLPARNLYDYLTLSLTDAHRLLMESADLNKTYFMKYSTLLDLESLKRIVSLYSEALGKFLATIEYGIASSYAHYLFENADRGGMEVFFDEFKLLFSLTSQIRMALGLFGLKNKVYPRYVAERIMAINKRNVRDTSTLNRFGGGLPHANEPFGTMSKNQGIILKEMAKIMSA